MKVIKLNRRFKIYKERGHEVAVRFSSYTRKASDLEEVCRTRLSLDSIWLVDRSWHSWFGASRDGRAKPYFISFQKESDLTFVLMCLTNK
jgi:hypothetical protein